MPNFTARNKKITVLKKQPQFLEELAKSKFMVKYPLLANIVIIIITAALGLLIVYFSLALFTKHGRSNIVPGVENMSYTEAVELLHDKGFRVEIRDSLYKEDCRPGFVIEQFPKSNSVVKPGRKIFLYINAVHPKEVIIDEDSRNPQENACKGESYRNVMARLEELGFKNVKVIRVLGDNEDFVLKITANGRTVKKMQKAPLNARIIVEIADGRLGALRDSLQNNEMMLLNRSNQQYYESPEIDFPDEPYVEPVPEEEPESPEVISF